MCLPLPASQWRATSFENRFLEHPVGWTYYDPDAAQGPVVRAHFGSTTKIEDLTKVDIRAVVRNASGFTLDESSQGSIAVIFRLANHRDGHSQYCTDFAAPYATVMRDEPGVFQAKFASPYAGPCPVAFAACSPSGAFLN